MNGQTEGKLIKGVIVTCAILFFVVLVRVLFTIPDIGKDSVCRFEHGDNWVYDYDNNFGRTCIELDFITTDIINRTKLNLTDGEIRGKYCSIPGFWEITKWTTSCRQDEK